MPYRANYPATVEEVLQDGRKYKPEVLRATRLFAQAKPWRGSIEDRVRKLHALHAALCAAYGKRTQVVIGHVGGDCYVPSLDLIRLSGRLSVVTYLHEFGHALGKDERQTCRWSINLFRRVFPRSFARCRREGHMLLRPDRVRQLSD